jgi:hypothetical protein
MPIENIDSTGITLDDPNKFIVQALACKATFSKDKRIEASPLIRIIIDNSRSTIDEPK